jgi:hypothetical protein
MIEVSIKCPCGTNAYVGITGVGGSNAWRCHCPNCLDPSSESAIANLQGLGECPEDAIASWWSIVEEAWEIDYLPVTLLAELSEQVGDERDRQEGWVFSPAPRFDKGAWYGPEVAP